MPLEAKIAPFSASSEDKEQVPTACGIKGHGGVCFSFPLASTCDVQADSLYLCWRRVTSFFSIYFSLMTNLTMWAYSPLVSVFFCCDFLSNLYMHTVFILF